MAIIVKTKEEINIIRQGGKILASVLRRLGESVAPGVSTGDLETLACDLIAAAGGQPSFKGYESGGRPFPTALCASINHEVVHAPALPSRVLQSGDIIGIDVGMEYKGYFTDMAATFGVGKISEEAKKLIKVTRESLERGLGQIKPGNSLNDIARAIQTFVEANGFSIVRDLVGHGVGHEVHEDPQIPNFVIPINDNIILRPGMVIAIEPMVNVGGFAIKNGKDGMTFETADKSLSAHFEYTVAVTAEGCEILTKNS